MLAEKVRDLKRLEGSRKVSAKAFNREISRTECLIAELTDQFSITGFVLPQPRKES
jgi:hypothetical protein